MSAHGKAETAVRSIRTGSMKKDNLLALPVRLILVPLRTVFYTLRIYELVNNITSYYGYIMYIYIIITLRLVEGIFTTYELVV